MDLETPSGGGKAKASAKEPSGGGDLPKTPSKADVKSVMGRVTARAAKCSKYSKETVQVKLVVGSNGRVKKATAQGSAAGTTAGKCVEMLARTAKFPKFADPSFTVIYPVVLR